MAKNTLQRSFHCFICSRKKRLSFFLAFLSVASFIFWGSGGLFTEVGLKCFSLLLRFVRTPDHSRYIYIFFSVRHSFVSLWSSRRPVDGMPGTKDAEAQEDWEGNADAAGQREMRVGSVNANSSSSSFDDFTPPSHSCSSSSSRSSLFSPLLSTVANTFYQRAPPAPVHPSTQRQEAHCMAPHVHSSPPTAEKAAHTPMNAVDVHTRPLEQRKAPCRADASKTSTGKGGEAHLGNEHPSTPSQPIDERRMLVEEEANKDKGRTFRMQSEEVAEGENSVRHRAFHPSARSPHPHQHPHTQTTRQHRRRPPHTYGSTPQWGANGPLLSPTPPSSLVSSSSSSSFCSHHHPSRARRSPVSFHDDHRYRSPPGASPAHRPYGPMADTEADRQYLIALFQNVFEHRSPGCPAAQRGAALSPTSEGDIPHWGGPTPSRQTPERPFCCPCRANAWRREGEGVAAMGEKWADWPHCSHDGPTGKQERWKRKERRGAGGGGVPPDRLSPAHRQWREKDDRGGDDFHDGRDRRMRDGTPLQERRPPDREDASGAHHRSHPRYEEAAPPSHRPHHHHHRYAAPPLPAIFWEKSSTRPHSGGNGTLEAAAERAASVAAAAQTTATHSAASLAYHHHRHPHLSLSPRSHKKHASLLRVGGGFEEEDEEVPPMPYRGTAFEAKTSFFTPLDARHDKTKSKRRDEMSCSTSSSSSSTISSTSAYLHPTEEKGPSRERRRVWGVYGSCQKGGNGVPPVERGSGDHWNDIRGREAAPRKVLFWDAWAAHERLGSATRAGSGRRDGSRARWTPDRLQTPRASQNPNVMARQQREEAKIIARYKAALDAKEKRKAVIARPEWQPFPAPPPLTDEKEAQLGESFGDPPSRVLSRVSAETEPKKGEGVHFSEGGYPTSTPNTSPTAFMRNSVDASEGDLLSFRNGSSSRRPPTTTCCQHTPSPTSAPHDRPEELARNVPTAASFPTAIASRGGGGGMASACLPVENDAAGTSPPPRCVRVRGASSHLHTSSLVPRLDAPTNERYAMKARPTTPAARHTNRATTPTPDATHPSEPMATTAKMVEGTMSSSPLGVRREVEDGAREGHLRDGCVKDETQRRAAPPRHSRVSFTAIPRTDSFCFPLSTFRLVEEGIRAGIPSKWARPSCRGHRFEETNLSKEKKSKSVVRAEAIKGRQMIS